MQINHIYWILTDVYNAKMYSNIVSEETVHIYCKSTKDTCPKSYVMWPLHWKHVTTTHHGQSLERWSNLYNS